MTRIPLVVRALAPILFAALVLLAAPAPPAARAELAAALSNHLVAVTTGFSGTSVLLFGATGGHGDVVVVVQGPPGIASVHRKGRRWGIWVNEADMSFANVPGFWSIASSRPIAEILPDAAADFHGLGVQWLRLVPLESTSERRAVEFRQALIRTRQREGLFSKEPGSITFVGQRLFRTDIWIPANAPIGTYTVSVFLIENGDVVSAETTPLVVGKVGFEARVYEFAQNQPLGYGVLAVLLAALAGWLGNLAFRKG